MNLKRTREDMAELLNKQVAKQSGMVTKQLAPLLDRAAGVADRIEQAQIELAKRVIPQPKPRRGQMALLLLTGFGAGYAIAYLMDSERGRTRRDELSSRFRHVSREATRTAQRTITAASDRATGLRNQFTFGPDNPNPDDLTLLDRVESQVFSDPSIPKGDINVMVVDGKAVLRGQVSEPQIGAIEAAVRKVVGVKDVENLLHTPGTPAPNKAAARAVGNGGTRSTK
jgi:osmotically-inducible protein OsmY